MGLGRLRRNGKENGHYYSGLHRDYSKDLFAIFYLLKGTIDPKP